MVEQYINFLDCIIYYVLEMSSEEKLQRTFHRLSKWYTMCEQAVWKIMYSGPPPAFIVYP